MDQVVITGIYLGVAEGMVLAMKAGLDPEAVVGALGGGVAKSWILENRSGKMISNDYPLGFGPRSTARTWGSRSSSPTRPARRCRSRRSPRSWRTGSWPRLRRRDMSNLARAIRTRSGLEG